MYGGHAERTHTFDTKSVLGTFHRQKLDGGTKWEGPLTSSTRVQLLSDDGGEEFSEDGTTSKDLTKPDFKKSHSEWGTSSSRN